jgi:alpha-tubulin suppressor-like RCC1 family protein
MADRVCTRYRDDDGLDVGCHLVTKEYLIENYPSLVDQAKIPGLWLWGRSRYGRLGDNTFEDQSSPVQTISGGTNWKSVSAGYHTAAIKTNGELWLWGYNYSGQLGDNLYGNRSSPVQTVSGGNNWRTVSAGGGQTAAIKTDGSLWLWGAGSSGILGNNCTTNRSSPVQTVSGGNNWRTVSAGGGQTAAIKTDGTLWLWGIGTSGQLGNCLTANQSSPVQTVSGGTSWRSVSAGGGHTAAIKTDGELWTWGSGALGRLGNNAITNQSSPVQTVSGGTNWRSVSAGSSHTAAIKTNGELWTWGSATSGQLGNNSVINSSSPVQTVSGGTNWRTVSAGDFHTGAIKTNGELWLWGTGICGILGTNSVTNQSSPVQTVSGGNNWRNVSAGAGHTAAIKDLGDF